AYRAMDAFLFASHSETQGMVVAEALASGVPVVAVDAPGVRELVRDGVNGALVTHDDAEVLARHLTGLAASSAWRALSRRARRSAGPFSIGATAARLRELYDALVTRGRRLHPGPDSPWAASVRRIRRELAIVGNLVEAAGGAVLASAEAVP